MIVAIKLIMHHIHYLYLMRLGYASYTSFLQNIYSFVIYLLMYLFIHQNI